ncbi:unnamed protein product [Didymodactylos carnosus]|uniref:Uncharacterized protein n=1 Tax=Didymodactylos carnosus TaxID=1234261 RepID=A0A8S2NN72_9BILA|nr:unnamed protein product [Didymodactylos carnosus]CAF4006728.1 unnamed protein product [Didymodactylos carnosus]
MVLIGICTFFPNRHTCKVNCGRASLTTSTIDSSTTSRITTELTTTITLSTSRASTTSTSSIVTVSSEWHVIDNHLLQVRQVESRPVSFTETSSGPDVNQSVETASPYSPSLLSGRINNVKRSIPQVSTVKSTVTGMKISVTPAWFEEIKVRPPIYLSSVTTTNTELRRSFDTLAKYRTVRDSQYNEPISFITKPFVPDLTSTETLIVLLDMLAQSNGMETSFARTPYTYDDRFYRAACGVINLSTIPLLTLNNDGSLLTAVFNVKLNLSYDEITSSENTIREFVVAFINDVSKTFNCKPEYIRVFEFSRGSLVAKWGFTTPDQQYTRDLAKKFVQEAQKPFSVELLVLSKAIPADYPITWEQVPSALQLHPNDFEPKFDRDYRNWPAHDSIQKRGNRPYYRPVGWYRHALRVIDKYGNNTSWLGMNNRPDEWAIAYHGTKKVAVSPIMKDELKPASVDAYRSTVVREKGPVAQNGIYLATHCNKGADANRYADSFTVKMPPGAATAEEKYKVVFQCRYNLDAYTEHPWTWTPEPYDHLAKEIRVYQMDGVRPYGILLKKVVQDMRCNLTGVWTCDDEERHVQDAGTYYISQFDDKVFWFGRQHKASWNFANVSYGIINEHVNKLTMQWGDLPLATNRYFGKLILEISSDYQILTKKEI